MEALGEGCFQGLCSPNRTWGLSQSCTTGIQFEVSLSHSREHGSELQQDGWMDCGQTVRIGDRRLVVYLMAPDPFPLGDQPGGRQRMEKLICRPLLQQLGLEVIGSVARPLLALYSGIR